jgi:hypothetical protein
MIWWKRNTVPILLIAMLGGCSNTMKPTDFAGTKPEMKPLAFFDGHTVSWGMVETAGGAPDTPFTSDMVGTTDPDGTLHLTQHFSFADGRKPERVWTFRRTGDHTYEGTANDVDGPAEGEAYGNLFHWTYTLELSPGNALKKVSMEQWMYLQPNGTMVNRVTIRKLGLVVAMVTEYFTKP